MSEPQLLPPTQVAVTIRDVAKAAGVSISTASRALSGRRRVSLEIERAVLAASQRLGYRTNLVARSLRMKSTGTVGMVVPGISNPYFPHLVEAFERHLSAIGRELLLCDSQDDAAIEGARVEALLDRRVDGLLFIPCHSRESASTLQYAAGQVPVIQVDRYVEGQEVDFIGVDNEVGIKLAVDHLLEQGRERYAFISSKTADSSAVERLHAYRKALGRLDRRSAHAVLLGDYSVEWGRAATQRLLADGQLPDAIVCAADVIALGVISALGEHSIRVPGDVAVTGFDDIRFAAISAPPLTTLRQPADGIGAQGVRLLQDRIDGDESPRKHRTLRPELIVRSSSRSDVATRDSKPSRRPGVRPVRPSARVTTRTTRSS